MNKFWQFVKSMKFGLILLGIIAAISIIGSLIPQNADTMTYVRTYPSVYQLIFTLQLNKIFTSWYFVILVILLCMNLIFCSLIRGRQLFKKDSFIENAGRIHSVEKLEPAGVQAVRNYLEKIHCNKKEYDDITVYSKYSIGRYGTFLTHLGILLTVVFWAFAMYLPKITDLTCMPDNSIFLEDGTEIYVDSFSITDETGKLDYKSNINVILPDKSESGLKEVSVNHPLSAGNYKIYQQTYGTKGIISVTDSEGHKDTFEMDQGDFLSKDGKNGIRYDNLYPGYTEENGEMRLITSTSGRYENPVYVFSSVLEGQEQEVMLAFPKDTYDVGDLVFTFEEPIEYPGLRIKYSPGWINVLLLVSFLIMTAGLYITFFTAQIIVSVDAEGYTVLGSKPESMRYHLKQISGRYRKEDPSC